MKGSLQGQEKPGIEQSANPWSTRLGGVAHNRLSMAMLLLTAEVCGDREREKHFFSLFDSPEMQNEYCP